MANRTAFTNPALRFAAALALAAPIVAAAADPPAPPKPVVVAPPAPQSPLPQLDPARLALAREIIAAGFPQDKREGLFFGAVDAMLAQMRKVMFAELGNDPGAVTIINRKLERFIGTSKGVLAAHIPALMDGMAKAYAREFSAEELAQYHAFVATPAGQHFFLRSSAIIGDPAFAAANESYMRDLQPLIAQMRDELTAEMVEYFKAHPPKGSSKS